MQLRKYNPEGTAVPSQITVDLSNVSVTLRSLLWDIVRESVSRATRQEKERKSLRRVKEEIKRFFFVNDRILYIENPKKPIKKAVRNGK